LDILKTYVAFWNTSADNLNPDKTYRIGVKAGPVELAYADVSILRRLRDAKDVNREEFVALPNDWTLPIAFTVEQGACVGSVTVEFGSGIDASLEAGRQWANCGSTISYEMLPRQGFRQVEVTLDGVAMASRGEVTVTGFHELRAWAQQDPRSSEGAELIQRELGALVAATDPVDALREFLARVDAALEATADETAFLRTLSALLNDAVAQDYSLADALSATGFPLGPTSTPLLSGDVTTLAAAPGSQSVGIVFVNGVHTDIGDAVSAYLGLKSVVRSGTNLGAAQFRLAWVRNQAAQSEIPRPCREAIDLLPPLPSFLDTFLAALTPCAKTFPGDLVEALGQMGNALAGFQYPPTADAQNLGSIIENLASRANKVVVVAHSQGNLVTQEALVRGGLSASALSRVSVIGLASPSEYRFSWGGTLDDRVVDFDVIRVPRLLIDRSVPEPFSTELSTAYQALLDEAQMRYSACLALVSQRSPWWSRQLVESACASAKLVDDLVDASWPIKLHSFLNSYVSLASPTSRAEVGRLIEFAANGPSLSETWSGTTTVSDPAVGGVPATYSLEVNFSSGSVADGTCVNPGSITNITPTTVTVSYPGCGISVVNYTLSGTTLTASGSITAFSDGRTIPVMWSLSEGTGS
jgi:hypothetical protein